MVGLVPQLPSTQQNSCNLKMSAKQENANKKKKEKIKPPTKHYFEFVCCHQIVGCSFAIVVAAVVVAARKL